MPPLTTEEIEALAKSFENWREAESAVTETYSFMTAMPRLLNAARENERLRADIARLRDIAPQCFNAETGRPL